MGAELHIRRRPPGPGDIPESEWMSFVAEELDFELLDGVSAVSPSGERIDVAGRYAAWTGHPGGAGVPFRWSRGAIHVAGGDEHVAERALLVAAAFGAVVVTDDGQQLDAGPEPAWEFPEPGEPGSAPVPAAPPVFDAPPPVEELPFEIEGSTIIDRMARWRQRRRR